MSSTSGFDHQPVPGRLPPVAELAVASMVLVVGGGAYVAAYLPHPAPPILPACLLVAAGVLLLGNVASLSRHRHFAWRIFFRVLGWALLAYLVIAGMLEVIVVLDGTRGATLVLLTLMLAVVAVDGPLLFAFSVARHRGPGPGPR